MIYIYKYIHTYIHVYAYIYVYIGLTLNPNLVPAPAVRLAALQLSQLPRNARVRHGLDSLRSWSLVHTGASESLATAALYHENTAGRTSRTRAWARWRQTCAPLAVLLRSALLRYCTTATARAFYALQSEATLCKKERAAATAGDIARLRRFAFTRYCYYQYCMVYGI